MMSSSVSYFKCAAISCLLIISFSVGGYTQVLSSQNSNKLCRPSTPQEAKAFEIPPGTRIVDYWRLADEILAAAQVRPWLLETISAPTTALDTTTLARQVESLRLTLAVESGDVQIFGVPEVPGWSEEAVRAERDRVQRSLGIELSELILLAAEADESDPSQPFAIYPSGSGASEIFPSNPFAPVPDLPKAVLICQDGVASNEAMVTLGPAVRQAMVSLTKRFMLRGQRDDLFFQMSRMRALLSFLTLQTITQTAPL
jgi:hypothetical protein